MMGMMGFGYLAMALAALIVLAVVVVAVWGAIHLLSGSRRPPAQDPDEAEQILDRRYARGEIDDQEYRRMRDALHSGR
jgi:putative membrane protein